MASGLSYLEGSTVRVQATFAVGGTDTDPTTVTLKVKSPSAVTTSYTYALSEVTKSATGVYYKDLGPTILTAGTWWYRWIGTGAAAGVAETAIIIAASDVD